jgi:hypothetical protein
MLHLDAFSNILLSTVHLNYFSAYVQTDVVVKSSELSSMHEDVKFKFISICDMTAQKLDMKITCIETIVKT